MRRFEPTFESRWKRSCENDLCIALVMDSVDLSEYSGFRGTLKGSLCKCFDRANLHCVAWAAERLLIKRFWGLGGQSAGLVAAWHGDRTDGERLCRNMAASAKLLMLLELSLTSYHVLREVSGGGCR
jgi:hypothetical protein